MYYYSQDPPYLVLFAGLFAGLACGAAFNGIIRQTAQAWKVDRRNVRLANTDNFSLRLPFLGICVGIVFFLSAGLEIFGFPTWLSYSIAGPMTLLTSFFLWYQLKGLFKELDRGGSAALDLDAWEE